VLTKPFGLDALAGLVAHALGAADRAGPVRKRNGG